MKSAISTYHCRVYFSILPLDALDLLLAVLVLLVVSEIRLEVKVLFKISKVKYNQVFLIVVKCIYVFFVPYCFRLCNVSSTAAKKTCVYIKFCFISGCLRIKINMIYLQLLVLPKPLTWRKNRKIQEIGKLIIKLIICCH